MVKKENCLEFKINSIISLIDKIRIQDNIEYLQSLKMVEIILIEEIDKINTNLLTDEDMDILRSQEINLFQRKMAQVMKEVEYECNKNKNTLTKLGMVLFKF